MPKPRKTRRKRVLKRKRLNKKTSKVGGYYKCNPVRVQNGNIKIVRNSGEVTSYQNREDCIYDKNFVVNDYLLDKHISTSKYFGDMYNQLNKNLADEIRELIKSKIENKGNQYRTQVQKRHAINTELEDILVIFHYYFKQKEINKHNVEQALKMVKSSNNFFQLFSKDNDYQRPIENDWQAQQLKEINAEEYNLKYGNNWTPNIKIGKYPQTYSQPYNGNTITTNKRPDDKFKYYGQKREEEEETYL